MAKMCLLCFLVLLHGSVASSNAESSCASSRTVDDQTATLNHKYGERTLLQHNQHGQDHTIAKEKPLEQAIGQHDFARSSDDGKLLDLFSRALGAKASSEASPDDKLQIRGLHADMLEQFKSSFMGMNIHEASPENSAQLHQLLTEMLELTNTCQQPVRVGNSNDGGYMFCEDSFPRGGPQQGCVLFSYGTKDDDSFDQQIHQSYNCEVHQFDPTVEGSEGSKKFPDQMHFHKEGLAGHGPGQIQGLGQVDTLANHFAKYHPGTHAFVLKVDIEENEWDSFHTVADSFWDNVDQLALEVHSALPTTKLEDVVAQLPMRLEILTALKKHFYLVHAHVNNHGEVTRDLPGHGPIPKAVELNFVRKTLMAPRTPPYDNHSELDQPCNKTKEDVDVSQFKPM